MIEQEVNGRGIRFSIHEGGKEMGRAYLYILRNDLHERPFGFVEDVFVNQEHRGGKVGVRLLATLIERARNENCYKLIATSRNDGTRQAVHDWYTRLGFQDHGTEFRINF